MASVTPTSEMNNMYPRVTAVPVGQPVADVPMAQPIVQAEVMDRGDLHPSGDLQAFGFILFERARVHPTKNLAGCYVSCSSAWGIFPGWPCPCLICRKFSAVDPDTLENDLNCCMLLPSSERGQASHYKRNPEGARDGTFPPNVFSNSEGAVEFGGANGLCAASTGFSMCDSSVSDVCYMRVC
jgi:hypothetical protein